jgi:predicted aspartyl protease
MSNAGVIFIRYLLVAAATAAFAGSACAEPATAPDCRLQRLASLDMDTQPDGSFAIPATIDGHDVRMVVDTGSQVSSISSETAREFHIETRPSAYVSEFFNGIVINRMAAIESFKIGVMSSKDTWHFILLPEQMMPPSVDGMLGPDIMQNYDVEIDYFGGKFNMFVPHPCPDQAMYWTTDTYASLPMKLDRDWHIVVSAKLDGKDVTVALDTGASTSIMNLDAARDLFGWDEKDPLLKRVTTERINNGAAAAIYNYPFSSLDLDGVVVKNPNIQLIPKQHFGRGGAHDSQIVLGTNVLRQLHIYVAYKEQVLYLTPAESKPPGTPAPVDASPRSTGPQSGGVTSPGAP